jgi:hypothetical protein
MCRSAHPRNRAHVAGVAPAAHRGRICPHGTDHAESRLPPEKTVGRRRIGAVAVPPAASHTKQRQARGFVLAFAGDSEPAVRRFSTEANARVRELASVAEANDETSWDSINDVVQQEPVGADDEDTLDLLAPSGIVKGDLSRRTSGCGPSWPTPSGSAMPPHDGVDGPATIRRMGLIPRFGLVQLAVPGRLRTFRRPQPDITSTGESPGGPATAPGSSTRAPRLLYTATGITADHVTASATEAKQTPHVNLLSCVRHGAEGPVTADQLVVMRPICCALMTASS